MDVRPATCPACGGNPHGAAPCAGHGTAPRAAVPLPLPLLLPEVPAVPATMGGPCSCLPETLDSAWRPCAVCGLVQAPGKMFCGYCGHRWVVDPAG